MIRINLITVGKLKEKYWRDAAAEYSKRLGAFCKLEIVELNESRLSDNPSEKEIAAALVGVFKAYQEMTGETINADIIDASLNELVVTGQLEQSIAGLSDEEVEEFIAYIKSVIAQNDLKDEASINQAIDDACSKYNVTLSDSERQQIVDLLLKITSLGINLDSLVDYAESLYHSFKDGGGDSSVLSSVGTFFSNVFSSIADFFKGLFS